MGRRGRLAGGGLVHRRALGPGRPRPESPLFARHGAAAAFHHRFPPGGRRHRSPRHLRLGRPPAPSRRRAFRQQPHSRLWRPPRHVLSGRVLALSRRDADRRAAQERSGALLRSGGAGSSGPAAQGCGLRGGSRRVAAPRGSKRTAGAGDTGRHDERRARLDFDCGHGPGPAGRALRRTPADLLHGGAGSGVGRTRPNGPDGRRARCGARLGADASGSRRPVRRGRGLERRRLADANVRAGGIPLAQPRQRILDP